jgi:hypothetical protein
MFCHKRSLYIVVANSKYFPHTPPCRRAKNEYWTFFSRNDFSFIRSRAIEPWHRSVWKMENNQFILRIQSKWNQKKIKFLLIFGYQAHARCQSHAFKLAHIFTSTYCATIGSFWLDFQRWMTFGDVMTFYDAFSGVSKGKSSLLVATRGKCNKWMSSDG